MLNAKELSDYSKWIKSNPVEIREAVIKAGGWSKVFPMEMEVAPSFPPRLVAKQEFPEWASRVRNFFNETPLSLRLLRSKEALFRTYTIKGKRNTVLPGAHDFALSGDVYVDEAERVWFEMSTAGTVYHYPGKVDAGKKVDAFLSSQATIPVFKLISPDGTGGSSEVCVHNPQVNKLYVPMLGRTIAYGEKRIGGEGVPTIIVTRAVTDEVYRGSYNYAETVIKGLEEHEYRDVKPHRETKGFYVNP